MRRGVLALAAAVARSPVRAAAAAPPPVSAPAYVVRGGPGGVVLAARAPDVQRAPASITKLMTVLVALEHARLDDVVTVSPQAAAVGESSVTSARASGSRCATSRSPPSSRAPTTPRPRSRSTSAAARSRGSSR